MDSERTHLCVLSFKKAPRNERLHARRRKVIFKAHHWGTSTQISGSIAITPDGPDLRARDDVLEDLGSLIWILMKDIIILSELWKARGSPNSL